MIEDFEIKYMILGFEEVPTIGTRHIQGYVHLGILIFRSSLMTQIGKKDIPEDMENSFFSY